MDIEALQVLLSGAPLLVVLLISAIALLFLVGRWWNPQSEARSKSFRGFFSVSENFKGMSPEGALYMQRVAFLFDSVVRAERQEEPMPVSREDIDPIAVSFSKMLEDLLSAARRVAADPQRYAKLVTWSNERTLHGIGRPTVEEALFETWIGFDDEFSDLLSENADLRRSEGRLEEAEQWDRRYRETKALGNQLGQMSYDSIQRLDRTS